MLKNVILVINEQQTLELEPGASVVQTVECCRVSRVDPEQGESFDPFITMARHDTLLHYSWDAPVYDWSEQVNHDPESEPRWSLING